MACVACRDACAFARRPERFFAAEMLREAIFEHYSEEIPYSCECRVQSFKEAEEIIRLKAEIYVSHECVAADPGDTPPELEPASLVFFCVCAPPPLKAQRSSPLCARRSQKGIVIGKKGAALKKVGTSARRRLEGFFQKKVYLETRVKVRPNWRQDDKALAEFGYV